MSDNADTRIVRRGTGCDGEDYFKVCYKSGGKPMERIIASRDLLSSNALRSIGVLTSSSRSVVVADAERALKNMRATFEVADRSGWFGNTFVWSDGECTGEEVPICLGPEYRDAERMRDYGTLTDWRPVGNLARGNTRVMLVISHAFTGPVAQLLGVEAPAIQLVGEAGVFKTSLCAIAAAIWGTGVKSWHQTSNGLEEVALHHHGTHLVLDDFRVDKKFPYRDLRAIAIRLLDGRTKGRMGDRSKTFCSPILSNSNRTLDEHARLAALPNDADQAALRGRLIEVPLVSDRSCLFEDMHGRVSALALIEELGLLAQDNAGRPAIEFVRRFHDLRCNDEDGIRRWLDDARREYETRARATFEDLPGYDLTRVHGRFATIYAAGLLANRLKLLRWSNAYLLEAIMTCEAAHLAICAEGGRGDIEGSPLTALRRHVAANWKTFVDLREGLQDPREHDHQACSGYINRQRDGMLELLFTKRELERVCGGPAAVLLLRSEVRAEGIIIERERRPSVARFIYRDKDPNRRVNVMALRAEAFRPFAPREGGTDHV